MSQFRYFRGSFQKLQQMQQVAVRKHTFASASIALGCVTPIFLHNAHCDALSFRKPAFKTEEMVVVKPKNNFPVSNVKQEEEPKVVDDSYWSYFINGAHSALQKLERGVRYMERVLTYLVYGAPLAGLLPANYLLGSTFPELENMTWGYFVWAVQQLGPCFIKMAQWASTRPDLFPPKLIDRLIEFQDDVKIRYPMSVVENTLTKAFGEDWKSKLVLNEVPLGTGSVAQVFQGLLKSAETTTEGIKVAVKMIHPHIEKLVHTDMELLTMFADWIDTFPQLEILSVGEACREFADTMNQQLDLRLEGSHLLKFSKKFQKENWAVFPMPIDGFVTKNVMVETLMEGTPINYFMNLKGEIGTAAHKLKMKLSDLGCRLVLKMIFFDNYIHGDLHPGNVLVQIMPNGDPRLVVLDCGIVYASKSDEEHQRLVDICFAFMQHDGMRAGKLMIENATFKENRVVQHTEDFCRAIQKIVDDSEKESYFEHISEYMGRICDLARTHLVRLDPGYFKIAMALKVAEGISLSLNHDLDLVTKCVPIVLKARAMRKLGIEQFPVPENDDEFMK